VIPDSVR